MKRGLTVLVLLLLWAAPARADCVDMTKSGSVVATQLQRVPTALDGFLLYAKDGTYFDGTAYVAEPVELKYDDGSVTFGPASGCVPYPDADTDVDGKVGKRKPWAGTRGLIDSHLHLIAEDMFGGNAHCGRPWHRFGVAYAMRDCPDHEPGQPGLQFENVLSGAPPGDTHDTTGWPTFADWPAPTSLTHEGAYHRWVERAYRGGLRLAVVLFFDNAQLCTAWPTKAHDCDEMDSVRRSIDRLKALRDYLDAQAGGPGRGWLRIVRTPFQARRVINRGKLAVVMGIETSRLFDCRVLDGVPQCDKQSLDTSLADIHAAGVRSLEITGKFDNALAGVAGDPGTNGVVTNTGNRLETGRYLDMRTCEGLPSGAIDKTQLSGLPVDPLIGGGVTPAYPPAPHCNQLGLSELGEHLVNRIADRRMIMDPDHMAAVARIAALDIFEARGYSGVLSSHSWSTPVDEPRIMKLGGVVFPKASAIGTASDPTWMTGEYERLKAMAEPGSFFGFGFGSDLNGIAKQPVAGADSKVTYPFTAYTGQTVRQSSAGERTWDYNAEGVAHYGLYLDWLEDLRLRLGAPFVKDMLRGPEAYLRMWERAAGVPAVARPARARKGMRAARLLRVAGQPRVRGARVWRYADGTKVRLSRRGRVTRVVS